MKIYKAICTWSDGYDTTMQAGIFMLDAGSGSQTYLISLGGTGDTAQSEYKFLIQYPFAIKYSVQCWLYAIRQIT